MVSTHKPLLVSELRKKLKAFPPNAPVIITDQANEAWVSIEAILWTGKSENNEAPEPKEAKSVVLQGAFLWNEDDEFDADGENGTNYGGLEDDPMGQPYGDVAFVTEDQQYPPRSIVDEVREAINRGEVTVVEPEEVDCVDTNRPFLSVC